MITLAGENLKLKQILERIDQDGGIPKRWALSACNSVRAGVNDHGPTHVRIVAYNALKILRLLVASGVSPGVVTQHGMTTLDAEVVVTLAGLLHDLGMTTHRDNHESHSLVLVHSLLPKLLDQLYDPTELVIITCEVLHAMIGHNQAQRCLTIEAGVVKIADALDMSKWRSRNIIKTGRVSIHSLSAAAIDKVTIEPGTSRPVAVEIIMNNSAGIFQVDNLLKNKVASSQIAQYFEITTRVVGEFERQHIQTYRLG